MYCSQSKNGQGDFASIAIRKGRVEFRFDTGSGPAILRSGVPINSGAWYTVYIERKLREGILKLSTGDLQDANKNADITGVATTVTGRSPGSTRGLNIRTNIYFGGVDDHEQYVVAEGVGVNNGFTGCIDNLKMGGQRRSRMGSHGGLRARRGRTSRNILELQKIKLVNLKQSIVDASNIFDCSSLQLEETFVALEPITG